MSGSGTPSRATRGCLYQGILAVLLPVVLLVGGMGLFLTVFVHSSCGCATPARPYNGPSPSPWPVSPSQAAAAAKSFTGVDMSAGAWDSADSLLYELTAAPSYAFVDGRTGRVLEAFSLDKMPASVSTSITPSAAEVAARSYLNAAGVAAVGMTSSVQLADRTSGAYFDVAWKDAGGISGPEILVNPTTGAAFSFADMGFAPKHGLLMPVVGQAAATSLAQSSTYAAAAQAVSTDFEVTAGLTGKPLFQWLVLFNDGVLSVDAVTGQVAILKWSSSR